MSLGFMVIFVQRVFYPIGIFRQMHTSSIYTSKINGLLKGFKFLMESLATCKQCIYQMML